MEGPRFLLYSFSRCAVSVLGSVVLLEDVGVVVVVECDWESLMPRTCRFRRACFWSGVSCQMSPLPVPEEGVLVVGVRGWGLGQEGFGLA